MLWIKKIKINEGNNRTNFIVITRPKSDVKGKNVKFT